jgi:hypothetical protein
VLFSKLEVLNLDRHDLCRSKNASDQHSEDGMLANVPNCRTRGCIRSFLHCSADNRLPTRTPKRLAPLTLRMPAARSGLSRPQSEASYVSLRTAASLRLIVEGAYLRCSNAIR